MADLGRAFSTRPHLSHFTVVLPIISPVGLRPQIRIFKWRRTQRSAHPLAIPASLSPNFILGILNVNPTRRLPAAAGLREIYIVIDKLVMN